MSPTLTAAVLAAAAAPNVGSAPSFLKTASITGLLVFAATVVSLVVALFLFWMARQGKIKEGIAVLGGLFIAGIAFGMAQTGGFTAAGASITSFFINSATPGAGG